VAKSGTTLAVHKGFPFLASIAINCASSVARNNVSPRIANPRFTDPQHGFTSAGILCRNIQNTRPVFASRATTSLIGWVRYMIPSTTSGVASKFWSEASA
jgi:hypothetical protein